MDRTRQSATTVTAFRLSDSPFMATVRINSGSALFQALQSTPLPWLAPASGVLITLINILAKSESNKNGMRLLEERCLSFLAIIQSEGEAMAPEERVKLCSRAQSTLQDILNRITPWCLMSRIKLFVKQDELAGVIQECHRELSDSLDKLQITSHLEIHRWQAAFEESQKIDSEAIVQYLADLSNTQQLLVDVQVQQSADVRRILTMMQENLAENVPQPVEHGLGSNLYNLLQRSGTLLPNMDLNRGEVRRVSSFAVKGTSRIDIWEGCYLNEEKVAIKVIRAVYASPKTLKRFKAEAEIWRRVYEADKGEYTLPIYGFCQKDGELPYIISPWVDRTLMDYIKEYPEVDHRSLLKRIAEGINVLHSMSVVHGDIKACNISVTMDGRPLLSDFGFTRLQEDIMSYFDVSNGSTLNQDSLRWCPFELCLGGSKRTAASDVYAFSMTALELFTHKEPWATVRLPSQVILKVCKGETPPRPTDPIVAERGLDDTLWALLEKCWCIGINDRLTMKEIVSCL